MLLNEDYFDDLKLTDDDIMSSDSTASEDMFKPHKKFQTGYEYILYCEKHYTDRLYIDFESSCYIIKPVTIKKIQALLYYLFNTYGIEHSELFLKDSYEDDDIVKIDDHSIPDYNIYDYGYIHLACKDPKIKKPDEEYESRWYALCMHFNMPHFNRQRGMKFLYNLAKTIFKRDEFLVRYFSIDGGYYYSNYDEEINVYSYDAKLSNDYDSFCMRMLRDYTKDYVLGCLCRNNKRTTYGSRH